MIIKPLFTVEEPGFKGSGNTMLALAPAQPLTAASLSEPWLLGAQGHIQPTGSHRSDREDAAALLAPEALATCSDQGHGSGKSPRALPLRAEPLTILTPVGHPPLSSGQH